MTLAFPTRPGPSHRTVNRYGHPTRAQACHGHTHLPDEPDGTCLICGRHCRATIDRTWRTQARKHAHA